ncbi:putative siderophore transport system ATP-binding protein YusV [Cohnella xylanilytica]|uniref:ABC transporter ATP-binding protein n=1 Tax=Cohnella xylanilytica TaxID=557555 RepID=A0A841U7Y0_9BACL|nr:ABC transporter ATP-binding protein [Cohnella xylanilytica]MBB6695782.1 ABC transporter ATP-binding protein [Cohnella xylanilytica]GIO15477.1 putative siderophore transport system ATP-binding protein YusV [Cohnella xylanilytica]
MSAIQADKLTLSYGKKPIFSDLDLRIPEGRITVFIGSNGCGKSTLLRSLARLLKPEQGTVLLGGSEIAKLSGKEIARRLAILPQGPLAPEGLTVHQLVKQGRYPYQSFLQQWSREDEAMVNKALQATGMDELAGRSIDSLSGGQRQRAWIAMTLAQNTSTILLDEPTTFLDMAHQIEILDLLFDLNERENRTVAMVLHDINLACRYAHHIVAVKAGAVYAEGAPEEIVDEKLIREVFGMECQVTRDPILGTPLVIPYGKGRKVTARE